MHNLVDIADIQSHVPEESAHRCIISLVYHYFIAYCHANAETAMCVDTETAMCVDLHDLQSLTLGISEQE